MRKAALALVLGVSLAAVPVSVTRGEGAAIGVRMAPLEVVGPGRIEADLDIAGFQADSPPTIEGTARIGDRVIEGPREPAVAAHLPAVIDLAAGTVRLGGVGLFHFTPVPPLDRNTPIEVEITIRRGSDVAAARRSAMLLLPTLVVPGYLNDLEAKPDAGVVSVLEERGYRIGGPSPTLFWFTYASRRFSLEDGAKALASYLHRTVLPSIYAARINVVGYSEGGLLTRWNLAFDPEWARLVNIFVMVGVPNQGATGSYWLGWYPALAGIAATPAAHDMLPTYPFLRSAPASPWTVPPDARNFALERLNEQPLPDGMPVYAFYGSSARLATLSGLTGSLPDVAFSHGRGDGIVLEASVLGLPINGGGPIPGFADRLIKVALGDVRHLALLRTAIHRIADLLTGRDQSRTTPSGP